MQQLQRALQQLQQTLRRSSESIPPCRIRLRMQGVEWLELGWGRVRVLRAGLGMSPPRLQQQRAKERRARAQSWLLQPSMLLQQLQQALQQLQQRRRARAQGMWR